MRFQKLFAVVFFVAQISATPIQDCITALISALGPDKVIVSNIPAAYNKVYDEIVPSAMVYPANARDVETVLNTAYGFSIVVAVRSHSGHSYVGQSVVDGSGIVMNLIGLNKFVVASTPREDDDTPTSVTVGGGMALLELYSRLSMVVPPLGINGGSCPSVAVGGLISGGGEGLSSTYGGMTSDRVTAAKVVVFQGGKFEEIQAGDDLLFALRGGMGGNYGVVTEWTLNAFSVSQVVVYSMRTRNLVPGTDDAAVHNMVRTYTTWMRNPSATVPLPAGNTVWGMIKFLSNGQMQLSGQCKCDSPHCSDCNNAIGHLEALLGKSLITKTSSEIQDFGEAMWSWGGCTEWGGVSAYPPGGLAGISEEKLQAAMQVCYKYDYDNFRGPYKAKSLYLPDETKLDDSFEAIALRLVTDKICSSGIASCYLQMSYVGGAMSTPHPNSAFVHRTPGFHLQMIVNWPEGMDETPFLDWTREARSQMYPLSLQTAYQNYLDIDLDLATWSKEYFPAAGVFNRLIDIKCKYNPTPIFNVPQALSMMIPQQCPPTAV